MQAILQIFCLLIYNVLSQIGSGNGSSMKQNEFSLCQSPDCTDHGSPMNQNEFSFCQSRDCIHHANVIMNNLNPDIDPCHDFYSFACGGYKKKFNENETRSVYDDTWQLLQKQMIDLIEKLKPEEGSTSAKLKTVYDNCMNVESSEMKAVTEAIDFLNYVGIPNWPNLNEGFRFSKLSKTLGQLAAYGEFAFVNFKPSPYVSKLPVPNLRPPALILQENFLLNNKWKPKNICSAVLRMLSYFNISKYEADNIWKEFSEIENAGIQLQNEEPRNPPNCKNMPNSSFREVNCSANVFGSMKFLCDLWKYAVEAGDLDKFYSTDILHISCSGSHFQYIDKIFSLLDKMNDKSLANYLSLRFLVNHLDDLNLFFHQTKKTYFGDKRSKTSEPLKRWEYCLSWIMKSMNFALGFEYTQKILSKTLQNSVLDMIKSYIQELSSSIKNLKWLGEKEKLYLQKQVVNLDIGFEKSLDSYRNKTLVESFYKMFSPKEGSFLRNILDYQKISLITKEEPTFNSLYAISDPYTMDFGLSLLQPPTFAYELPKILNYAALGHVIGHELSHNLKSFFDIVHLDENVEKYFNNKMQCFIQQYSQFIAEKTGKVVSSSETTEEIIADNLGWALTEKVIKKITNNKRYELFKLPGLNYTPLELVYISFAQDSCAALSKSTEAEFYVSKQHNLPNLRINGVLQNSKTFSETFKCALGDTMNPEYKCTFFE